jgi:hypothetical protein
MALMGISGASGVSTDWGGPVTIGKDNPLNDYSPGMMDGRGNWRADASFPENGVYVGPELYYAWGVPTGLKASYYSGASPDPTSTTAGRGDKVTVDRFYTPSGVTGKNFLENFKYDSRNIGLKDDASSRGINPATWILFPTLRVPLLMDHWTADGLVATLAASADQPMEGLITRLDEVHLLQVARLRRNSQEKLEQVIFGPDYKKSTDNITKVLAERIVGLQFSYNPVTRLLTLHIAARGMERHSAASAPPPSWPAWLPALPAEALHYRLAAKSITWRIRN